MVDLFAKCGCNCGRCPAYHENIKTDDDRRRCSEGWKKYLGATVKPDLCYCLGCQTPNPWLSGNIMPDRGCFIRPCAIKNAIETCAQCSAYPCEYLRLRTPDEHFRSNIANRRGTPIPEEDYRTFIKPYEGLKHLAEIRASFGSEDIVEAARPAPLKAKVVDFPENLPISPNETAAYNVLHRLMTHMVTARSDTYAQQEVLMRRRHNILNILWVCGRYGDFKEESGEHLVVEGETCGSHKEFGNIVRKRDNALHGPAQLAFFALKDYGVHGRHIPLGKQKWLLKLSFDENAGGVAALRALKRYITRLVEKHGEPTYAGSSRYKGEAFNLFKKVDMRILGVELGD